MNQKAVIDDEEIVIQEEVLEEEVVIDQEETEEEEVIVSIGEESPPPEEHTQAPEWVRELRKTNRELQRQNRELQSKLQTVPTEPNPVVIGTKPKLEDHDYDSDKYEEALSNWFERKRQADEINAKQNAEVMDQQKAWQAKLDN